MFVHIQHAWLVKKFYLCRTSRSFDRHLISNYDVFSNLVLNNQVVHENLPSVLPSHIADKAEVAYKQFNAPKRDRCIQGCLLDAALEPFRNHHGDCSTATRMRQFSFNFPIPRAPGQSDE